MKKNPKLEARRKTMTNRLQVRDIYEVDGVRYIREDLVPEKMEAIMERIAIAQETQTAFYKRWERKMDTLWDLLEKGLKKSMSKI